MHEVTFSRYLGLEGHHNAFVGRTQAIPRIPNRRSHREIECEFLYSA